MSFLRTLAALITVCLATAVSASAQPAAAAPPPTGWVADSLTPFLVAPAAGALASGQPSSPAMGGAREDWKVGIYPIYVWLPFSIGLDVTVPPDEGDGGDGGGERGEIIDSRFDGAYFGGGYASKGRFRMDADGLWAAFGGDRPDLPFLRVDVDAIYFHATAGLRLAGDLYAVGGVRRLALKYDIEIASLPSFERKPGVWDPVVGLAWHTEGGRVLELHAVFEGGGFGVGTERELAASARVDLKPFRHFGITAGYSVLHFKIEDTVANRTLTARQTLHGPVAGIGFYF
jgi:hypothetical protein